MDAAGGGEFPHYRDFASLLPSPRRFRVDDFDVSVKVLGRGKLGTVYRAREKGSKTVVVLKAVEKAAIREEDLLSQIQRETEIHTRLKHPNIVEMFAYFHEGSKCYMVMEYANGGTLYSKLQTLPGKRMAESEAANVVKQVCMALHYLHSQNVIHRDLKPENILLHVDPKTKSTTVKLADFGWSVAMKKDSVRRTLCGTVEYLPPEVAEGCEYDFQFDMWTVGILTYEMLCGHSPFADPSLGEDQDSDAVMERIKAGRFVVPHHVSPAAASLVQALLVLHPTHRLGPVDVLTHPWVTGHCGTCPPLPDTRCVKVETIAPWKGVPSYTPARIMPGCGPVPGGSGKASTSRLPGGGVGTTGLPDGTAVMPGMAGGHGGI